MTTETKPLLRKARTITSCFKCPWPIHKGESYHEVDKHPVCNKCFKEEKQ